MNNAPKFDHLTQYKWKPGTSGNKGGRPKSVVTILKEMGYVKPVISAMVCEIMFMPYYQVSLISDDRNESVIRRAIAEAFREAAQSGEYKYITDYMKLIPQFLPFNPEPVKCDNQTENSHESK